MKRKLQVFVSSTFEDMTAERQAAVDAILRAGHIPAGMELFAAGDESQVETIRRWIDDSDVFMLILGGRYGSLEPNSGKSYIELEYNHALKRKKPLFAAVITDSYLDAKVRAAGRSAVETSNGTLMQAFRGRVTQKICRFFGDINELKLIVFESMSNFERNEELAGWVRGSDVIDPKATLEELTRLQAENGALRKELADIKEFLDRSDIEDALESLSDDSKEILMQSRNADGYILYTEDGDGACLQAGDTNLIVPSNDNRQRARWKAALDDLVERGLVESVGHEGQNFRLTKLGYSTADRFDPPITEVQLGQPDRP